MKFKESEAISNQRENESRNFDRLLWLDTEVIHEDEENKELYNDDNHIEEFNSLKENIKEFGIKQPILIKPHPFLPMEFMVIAGHRRLKIAKELGIKVPVQIYNISSEKDNIRAKVLLIKTNQLVRERTPAEKLKEVEKLEEYYKYLRKEDPNQFRGSTRSIIASDLGITERQVADYQKLKNNLKEDDRKEFDNGKINMKEALDKVNSYQNLDVDEVCEVFIHSENPKEENEFSNLSVKEIDSKLENIIENGTINKDNFSVEKVSGSNRKIKVSDNKQKTSKVLNIGTLANNIKRYNDRYNLKKKSESMLLFNTFFNKLSKVSSESLTKEEKEVLNNIKETIEKLL